MAVIFSKNFTSAVSNGIQGMLPLVMGVPSSVVNGTNDRYIVSIISKFPGQSKPVTINAFLQEKIQMDASSSWSNIGQVFGSEAVDTLVEGATSVLAGAGIGQRISTKSTIATRRKWQSSEPIKMTLKLRFEAYSDVYTEVISPCFGLQSLTLPSGGLADTFFLRPPGPDPFSWNAKTSTSLGELITVNVGNFLNFDSVIVENVSVNYDNRMSSRGPTGATAILSFSTYQMLTKADLASIYNNTNISYEGDLGLSLKKSGVAGPATGLGSGATSTGGTP